MMLRRKGGALKRRYPITFGRTGTVASMRLGVLGGSFNPIHYGHIAIAQAAMAEAGLSQILLMVAADPPHKQVAGGVQPAIRLEMARLAEQAYPALQACSLELERQGKSYTADTAQALHSLYPDREICWLIGGDMLLTLENWHDPKRLLNSLHFLVAGRPDSPGLELAAQRLRERYGARITLLQAQGPDISSSRIRQKVREGLPIETDTCSTVVQYIYEQGLYLPPEVGRIVAQLRRELDPKRFRHTMGVARAAALLAQAHGVDPGQARLAALLHDCAKGNTQALAEAYGAQVADMAPPIRHAPVGAIHARNAYGVQDPAILQAIARHTVCGPNMTALDKVIYLADKIEPGRTYGSVAAIRKAAERSLDEGMLACIHQTAAYLQQQGETLHPATLAARDEIQNQVRG